MGLNIDTFEGQTPLDEDELDGLLIRSISTRQQLDQYEQLNIEKAGKWVRRPHINTKQVLTERFIKQVHKKMFGDVWSWAGTFRTTNKSIGIEWYQITSELRKLLDDCTYWIKHKTFPPDEIAIRFKFRLVYIHCFNNGNGRHSRIMADLIAQKIFDRPAFTWNGSRENYIKAIKAADLNNITPLLKFARG